MSLVSFLSLVFHETPCKAAKKSFNAEKGKVNAELRRVLVRCPFCPKFFTKPRAKPQRGLLICFYAGSHTVLRELRFLKYSNISLLVILDNLAFVFLLLVHTCNSVK